MDNKTLFIEAHKIARSTVAEVGNYQIAFKLALAEVKQAEAKKVSTGERVVNVVKSINLDNVGFMIVAVFMCIVLFGGITMIALSAGNTIGASFTACLGTFLVGLVIWSVIDDTKDRYNMYYKNSLAC